MPVTKSAIKAMKQSRKANVRNKAVKADFRAKIKVAKKAAVTDEKNLGKNISEAIQSIDKAAKNGVIHKNTAARRKSRLMIALSKSVGKVIELTSIKVNPQIKSSTTKAKVTVKKSPAKK